MKIYKVMIDQIASDGKHTGKSVLTRDFTALSSAILEGASHRLSPLSSFYVREYDFDKNPIQTVTFGNGDSGSPVYEAVGLKETRRQLFDFVVDVYRSEEVELSEGFLSGVAVKMPKKELLLAWSDVEKEINGDVVVRLDQDGKECGELLPEGWGEEEVFGDAEELLVAINEEREKGGPVFARWYDDNESYLDLVYGELDFQFENQTKEAEGEK